jgi:hypothetical protein
MDDPIDFENVKPEDTASLPDAITPDPKASKDRPKWRIPAGDKADAKPRARKKAAPRAKHGMFTEPLTQMYAAVGAVWATFDPVCGSKVLESAPACAQSLDDLAYQNESVRRALAALTTTSAIGAVIAAHAPILMAIYMHHSPNAQILASMMGQQFADNVEQEMKSNGEN